jgi:hypothetical protein
LVISALGNALPAIAAIQRDSNRLTVVVPGVVSAIISVATIAVIVSGMVIVIVSGMVAVTVVVSGMVIMVVSLMITITVIMTAVVLFAKRSVVGDRAAIGASASPADDADNGKSGKHVHPVLHSSILRHLIW